MERYYNMSENLIQNKYCSRWEFITSKIVPKQIYKAITMFGMSEYNYSMLKDYQQNHKPRN